MQKTNSQAKSMRRQMQNSTTLSRRYVRKPQGGVSIKVNCIDSQAKQSVDKKNTMQKDSQVASQVNSQTKHKIDVQVEHQTMSQMNNQMEDGCVKVQMDNQMMNQMKNQTMSMTAELSASDMSSQTKESQLAAKELKDQAIEKALKSALSNSASTNKKRKDSKLSFGFSKVLLAVSCATAVVAVIAYFVNMSTPDIPLQVAALQTGINASYPSYIPRDFSVSSVTSEDGKIVMEFNNFKNGDSFTLTEETSLWDSSALESNYVKEQFAENYTITKEQGLTIYISRSDAAWVNGGVVFKLNTTSGSLTNKQIKSIAVST